MEGLPGDLILKIANLANAEAALRLVCRETRAAIPLKRVHCRRDFIEYHELEWVAARSPEAKSLFLAEHRAPALTRLPETLGALSLLKSIRLARCGLVELPASMSTLTSLRNLDILWCRALTAVPLDGLVSLETLTVNRCPIHSLHDLQALRSLHTLTLIVTELASLPDSVSALVSLRLLGLVHCERLRALPEGVGRLPLLESLSLRGCTGLRPLPASLGDLAALRALCLDYCSGIRALPESLGGLTALETLSLRWCVGLRGLPESIRGLAGLVTLFLNGCTSLRGLPGGITGMRSLCVLSLRDCEGLRGLPDGLAKLPLLGYVCVAECTGLGVQGSPLICPGNYPEGVHWVVKLLADSKPEIKVDARDQEQRRNDFVFRDSSRPEEPEETERAPHKAHEWLNVRGHRGFARRLA